MCGHNGDDAGASGQDLVREAISQGHAAVGPAALAGQIRLFRSATLIGASQTAESRPGAGMPGPDTQ